MAIMTIFILLWNQSTFRSSAVVVAIVMVIVVWGTIC
jgi:hypothetical protein